MHNNKPLTTMPVDLLLNLTVPLTFGVFLVLERWRAARHFPRPPRWAGTGWLFFGLTLAVGGALPRLLPPDAGWRLFDLSSLGLGGVPLGVLATTLAGYWLHRAEHRFDWLWRAAHRLHHSAVRVDTLGAFYAHPLEVVLKVLLATLVCLPVLGLSPMAAVVTQLTVALLSLFQHLNLATPHWLGRLVQRPESHCVHHQKGVAGRNFSELPLWDMVFGTYSNPRQPFTGAVGLDADPTQRPLDLLLMRDASGRP